MVDQQDLIQGVVEEDITEDDKPKKSKKKSFSGFFFGSKGKCKTEVKKKLGWIQPVLQPLYKFVHKVW